MELMQKVFDLTGIRVDTIIQSLLNACCGGIGAYINFSINQLRAFGWDWTFKHCRIWSLFNWCLIGALSGVVWTTPGSYRKALLCGFVALTLWDQFLSRGGPSSTVAGGLNKFSKDAVKKSKKAIEKGMSDILEEFKDDISEDE